ncbi:MAG: S-adenosylmethionine:tRNA ribosyltransferase-isomerase [Kiritimatiellaeota bacterium]|nr:S-adenosylmethionine:tRNA ribosyltransferase-isomerase [Kiritimatiellota bacterium]
MKIHAYDYTLPPELIAQAPAPRRDQSRLMVVQRAAGTLEHRRFDELPACLRAGDLLVVNDTRVIPARLFGKKATGGSVELLLLEEREPGVWDALLHSASRRPRLGAAFTLAGGQATATLLAEGENQRAADSRTARPLRTAAAAALYPEG